MRIEVVYGALAEPLHRQLGVPKGRIARWQKIADAITLLTIQQFLRESEIHRMRRKLTRELAYFTAEWRRGKSRRRARAVAQEERSV